MSLVIYAIAVVLLLLLFAETGARLYHRYHFRIPFRSKVIGEYPYRSFIEKVDGPLQFRLKKGFRSKMVNINRYRCRGPEPAPDGKKKRLLLIGESNFFGVKLRREKDLWSIKLEKLLHEKGYGDWEVLNAGNPTYNSFQHRFLWEEELRSSKPDILILDMGANDVSQAWMMGSRWKPAEPWPWEFIMAMEKKSPWWNHILARFCTYFLIRRSMTERKAFPRWDEEFQWERCLESIGENYRIIAEDARRAGARVACTLYAFAYLLSPSPREVRALEAIQANWKTFIEGRGKYDYALIDYVREKLGRDVDMPYLDMLETFHNHPRRYELYLDLAHYNDTGMDLVAETLYREIDNSGWW